MPPAVKKQLFCPKAGIAYANVALVNVSSDHLALKLVSISGFTDYCFDMSVDNALMNSFRFNGSYNIWNFQNMQAGQHLLSFVCMHTCADEDNKEIMKFEIDDGKSIQYITVGETDHCKHDFWIKVSK